MEFFLKKIFEGKNDDMVHLQFVKFGKGEYKDRAVIRVKNSSGKYSIRTTHEYANELVLAFAEKLEGKSQINGVIVSTSNLKDKINFADIKQFMGVKKYVVDSEMSGAEIVDLCKKFPKCFFGLSFKVGDSELKIKPKMPKSGKPNTKNDEAPAPDFCKVKTTDKNIVRGLLFDVGENFKQAEANHTFVINEIIYPENESDPAKIREMSQRKGKIIRKLVVDESESVSEKDFCA